MIYYVSNLGCDANDGKSPETAWKTVEKVNEAMCGGDEIRFRCGDTFYGRIATKAGPSPEDPTVLTSYGEGKKPVISQYKIAKKGVYEKDSENVWKLDLIDPAKCDGTRAEDANIGFMKMGENIFPKKKFRPEDMTEQWDFYCDDRYIYIYSDKCPEEYCDNIRFACGTRSVAFADNTRYTNLEISGSGAHGISGVVNNSYIADCDFHELGGSRLGGLERNGKFNTTRYGNGVECWSNSSNVTVERCRFSGIYDVAITMQGGNVQKSWHNMIFRDNIMWNCQQCFEIWSSGDKPDTGFVDCHFENNVCIDSGYCWGYDVRPNKIVSSALLLYGLECPLCEISIKGNTFINSRLYTIFKSGGLRALPKTYVLTDNTIIRPIGQPLIFPGDASEQEMKDYEELIAKNNMIKNMEIYK